MTSGLKALTSGAQLASLERLMTETLQYVLSTLSRAGVRYCILRNRHRIPSGLVEGSDVDLIVSPQLNADRLIVSLSTLRPLHIVIRREVARFYFPVLDRFLIVDLLYRDQEWLGARILRNHEILDHAYDDNGLPVASQLHQAIFAWLHSLLWGGFVKQRYATLIQNAYLQQSTEFGAALAELFGVRLGSRLEESLRTGAIDQSAALARRARWTLWARAFHQHPLRTLQGWLDHFRQELRLRSRSGYPGLVVAVLGPDGAGKSAVCTALASQPRGSLPFTSVDYQHWYRRVLPALADLRRGRIRSPRATGPVTDPHGNRPYGTLLSTVRMAYFALDQWLSELFRDRHLLAKNALLLHDRHALDALVDWRRYRFGCGRWLIKLYARCSPRPDLVIVLDAPAEVLQQRKQEVTREESERQRASYRDLAEQLPNGYIVDSSRPLQEVVEEVRDVVIRFVAQRTARRFNLENAP